MTNKEKKECVVSHLYGKDNDKELHFYCENCDKEMEFYEKRICSAFSPDPLTSLLQSAEREFEENCDKHYDAGGWNIPYEGYEHDRLKSFLLSKLTEAFNKGSQYEKGGDNSRG